MAYSLIFICIYIISTIVSNAETVFNTPMCLWGRQAYYYREVNGLYRYGGFANDKQYYVLDNSGKGCGSDYYWLYWINTDGVGRGIGWHIGTSSSSTFGFASGGYAVSTVAYCTGGGTVNYPSNCGANWEFLSIYGEWITDGNVTVSPNRCPQLNCEQITITGNFTVGGCNSYTNSAKTVTAAYNQTGANIYSLTKSGFGTYYWAFYPLLWQWQCIKTNSGAEPFLDCANFSTPNGAGDLWGWAGRQDWQSLSNGGSITITDVTGYSGCTSGGCELTFTCSGEATTSTYGPTTPNPTKGEFPTPRPTFKPVTESPTAEPSAAPIEPTITTATGIVTPSPTSPTAPTAAGSSSGSGGGGDGILGIGGWNGLDWLWWILILLLICCLCCLCIFCCLKCCEKRREKRQQNVEMFGNQDQAGGGQGSYQPDPTYTVD